MIKWMKPSNGLWWPQRVWQATRGCTSKSEIISPGCLRCMARQAGGSHWDWSPVELEENLYQPLDEETPWHILVSPYGDAFHDDISTDYLERVIYVMQEAHWHTFYLLTRRQRRMEKVLSECGCWPLPNVNIGISVENQRCLVGRMPSFLRTPVHADAYKYLSCEPLLGHIDLGNYVHEIGWVTATPERRAPVARPMEQEWMDSLKLQCYRAGVPLYEHRSENLKELLQPHTVGSSHNWRRKVAMAQHGLLA